MYTAGTYTLLNQFVASCVVMNMNMVVAKLKNSSVSWPAFPSALLFSLPESAVHESTSGDLVHFGEPPKTGSGSVSWDARIGLK